ncbi:ABC transporter permease [Ferdinandcohnia sp. Marseille-Q9671]
MSGNLFLHRLRKECTYQWGVWKSVVDWTIFIYIFIPPLIIGGYHYYTWWNEIPGWFDRIPLSIIIIILYIICWQGRIRTFLEEADQLFLLQKRSHVMRLKKQTRNFYLTGYSLGIITVVMLLAPFLYQEYKLSWFDILSVTFYFSSLKSFILGLKQSLDDINSVWKNGFCTVILFLAVGTFTISFVPWIVTTNSLFLVVLGFVQWLLFFLQSSRRVRLLTTFSKDVYVDKMEKLKYVKSIFVFSEYVEKVPGQRKRSSIFYKNSKRIYKKRNRQKSLQELFIKAFIRNKTYLLQYFQITGITIGAIIAIPPIWIKCLLFLALNVFLRMWVKTVYKRIMSNHFIITVRKDDSIRLQAEHYIVNLISIPVLSIVGLLILLLIL